MLSVFLSIILLLVILNQLYHFVFDKPTKNVPPGLPRLPIWGSYWFLLWGDYTFPYRTIKHCVKKYKSKVVSLWLGDFFTVVVTDYKSIKELLKNSNFDGRLTEAYLFKVRASGKKLGVFFTDGEQWKEQRRYALRQMREFGFGRRMEKFESESAEELSTMIDILKNGPINDEERKLIKDGKAYFPDILYPFSANFILSIITGERAPREEHKKLRDVSNSAAQFQRHSDTTGGAILITPWLRHLGHGFSLSEYIEGSMGITNFIKDYVKTQKATFIDDASRGLLDVYIKKLKESKEFSFFSEEQLLMACTDFMFPSLTALPWGVAVFVKYMVHHPHIMEKVQKEIDSVIGRDRLITLDDRVNLPYTDATIREVMRADTMTPWSIAHRAIEDDKLCGYDIPANTVLVTDLHSMHHDPEFWGDPENVRPERFLNEDGSLGKDDTLPFGAGGRLCAGETFARQFLFLASAALAQNFNFEFVEGEPSSLDDRLPGVVTGPKNLWMKVIPRT